MSRGTVAKLFRWPVKSMAGERVAALCVDGRGAAGDRTHALEHPRGGGRLLTAREAAGLLAWRAGYEDVADDALDPAAPPEPILTAPDGARLAWGDPALPAALQADLGLDAPAALRRDPEGQQDLGRTLLVTTRRSLDALSGELGTTLDLRRFRPNVHVELDAAGWAELAWEGLRLRVGEAELELLGPCERCVIPTRDPDTRKRWPDLAKHLAARHDNLFGMNARPLGPAVIREGDAVELVVGQPARSAAR